MFAFFCFWVEIPFWGKFGPKSQNCQFKLKFPRYLLLRLKFRSAKGASLHPVSWATAQQLVTCFSLMYLVDEFFCLFLVLLTKWKTLRESKVSGVNQGNEGGRWVKDFLILSQGFRNFPSVFWRERWRIWCAWIVYIWLNQWWLVCWRCNWTVGSSINVLTDLILLPNRHKVHS